MKMAHLSRTSPNISSIVEVCNRLGKTFLTSLVGNHWATGGLLVNSCLEKGGLLIVPFFLLVGNAILPITPEADCAPWEVNWLRLQGLFWLVNQDQALMVGPYAGNSKRVVKMRLVWTWFLQKRVCSKWASTTEKHHLAIYFGWYKL